MLFLATLTCRDCRKKFQEVPNKPGYRNQCPDCSQKQKEPERIGGNMIYLHKTGGYIELKPMSKAREFAKKTRRLGGTGVTASITQSKENNFE